LAQAFLAGVLLARQWNWLLLPAAALALLGFMLRVPLVVVARHRFLWRRWTAESRAAARWAVLESLGLAVCLALLRPHVKVAGLAGLVGAGAVLTLYSVRMSLRNRQRSVLLQLVSTAGLSAAALLAVLAATGEIPGWAWALWGVLAAHGTATIPVVHARLKMKIAATREAPASPRRAAVVSQAVQLAAAAGLALYHPAVATVMTFSSVANLYEVVRLGSSEGLKEPLRRVGRRLLVVSILHAVLTVAALWRVAHP